MNDQLKINWYRSPVDRAVMSELMRTSDLRGFLQVIPQLALFAVTGALAYAAFLNVSSDTWPWAVPLLLGALFVHGTFSSFLGSVGPVHELCHKTPFRSKALNEFFLKIFSFLSWSDYVGFRPSHVKHHQVTVHTDHDGEVVLPRKLNLDFVSFYLGLLTVRPTIIARRIGALVAATRGRVVDGELNGPWLQRVLPETNPALRAEHRRWAWTVLLGQAALAAAFIATGHPFLILIVNFGSFYCFWFAALCGIPQHIGLSPNVPDFRLCCRTYTCGRFIGFLYWNMNYHVEHHMFPAVPFYNLPKLRAAIAADLPSAPHGLITTWREILPVLRRQDTDPSYAFIPVLPETPRTSA
jgi:fatty acid desaturase